MSTIKLYYYPGACSLAPHILLHETKLPFTLSKEVAGLTPELRAKNPKAKIPVLTIDDTVITENIAIQTAIGNLAPSLALLGAPGTLESVRVYEWLSWLSTSLHAAAFGSLFRPGRFTTSEDEGVLEGIRDKARESIMGTFDLVEGKLTGVHAVGERFTAVDAYLFVFYRWGARSWDMKALWPKYAALAAGVGARESVVKALEAEEA
ncbi:hypothetical protein N7466_006130 [Penicillium verhagenii]|uniref:uncharacterized protein n=1 Tax=Penicillium verhagenii TaxID=1562060 RepID=UPI002545B3E8|nr:uncharacterized protein N7466_006130 [Penicillium verhagenii]KAJ5930637.1 hypothetical protein N7466_006130 [Penicillium verhagenii]